jgi:hypothetical protein
MARGLPVGYGIDGVFVASSLLAQAGQEKRLGAGGGEA